MIGRRVASVAADRSTTRLANRRRAQSGLVVAGATALISGVAVFANSYGVRALHQAAVYTTAKNMVAFLCLAAYALLRPSGAAALPVSAPVRRGAWRLGRMAGLAYVGVIGGGVAFVLFFDGLARTAATPAALAHDTLVVWVVVMAGPWLRERVTGWNLAAIALLVGGEVTLAGVGHLALSGGLLLVLAATVLWSVETIVAKALLADLAPGSLALVRMGVGSTVLVGYLWLTGALGDLGSLDRAQTGWILLTGLLLAAYVGTWMTALSRARALDVTSVLVASAGVTALLQATTGSFRLAPESLGLLLCLAGTALLVRVWPGRALR